MMKEVLVILIESPMLTY